MSERIVRSMSAEDVDQLFEPDTYGDQYDLDSTEIIQAPKEERDEPGRSVRTVSKGPIRHRTTTKTEYPDFGKRIPAITHEAQTAIVSTRDDSQPGAVGKPEPYNLNKHGEIDDIPDTGATPAQMREALVESGASSVDGIDPQDFENARKANGGTSTKHTPVAKVSK